MFVKYRSSKTLLILLSMDSGSSDFFSSTEESFRPSVVSIGWCFWSKRWRWWWSLRISIVSICIASYVKKRQCWFLDFMITVSVFFLSKRNCWIFLYDLLLQKTTPRKYKLQQEVQNYSIALIVRFQTSSTYWVFSWKVQHRFFVCVVISIIIIWLSIFLPHRTHNWQQTIGRQITTCSILPVIIYCIDFLTKRY